MLGPGGVVVGKGVRPRPDEPLARDGEAREQPEDGVRVAVGPAADRVHRHLDRVVVLADGAVPPVAVAALVREPVLDVGRRPLQSLDPDLAPRVGEQRGVGRPRVPRQHRGGPVEHVAREDAAAAVVDVVGVAVVGRAERHDRAERRRPERGDLKRVEAAPRDAGHPDRARAPGLRGQPGDHLERVLLLLRGVLVVEDPVRLAAAADVDAHRRVAVAREVGLADRVAGGRAVVLAVGQVLEDGRDRVALGVLGQPDPRGEPGPAGELDPGVLDLANRPRQPVPGHDSHRPILRRLRE
jgi:hypothetical protein